MKCASASISAVLWSLGVTPVAFGLGSDTHYRDTPIGERAAAMGGAFTALADEATGAFYNPAGLAVDGSTLIQVSMSAYKLRVQSAEALDLCGNRLKDDQGGFFAVPAAVGIAKLFGPQALRHAVGLVLTMPFASRVSQQLSARDVDCGPLAIDVGANEAEVDRVFRLGLVYAIRPASWLQLGVSFGISARSVSNTQFTATQRSVSGALVPPFVLYQHLSGTLWSFFVQLGALVQLSESWRFGLSVTTPYARIAGAGRVDVVEADLADDGSSTLDTTILDDAEFFWKVPVNVVVGAAYTLFRRLTLAADVSFHGSVGRYQQFRHALLAEEFISENERDVVVNFSVGAQWLVSPRWALRGGFFTNLTSRPDAPVQELDGERTDLFGFSWGGSFRSSAASTLAAAMQLQFGSGRLQKDRIVAGQTLEELRLETVEGKVRNFTLVLSVGGSVDLH